MAKESKKLTFYEQRMQLLGVTEDNNSMRIKDPLAEFPAPGSYEVPIFSEHQGNIKIMFWTLDRETITYVQTSDAKMGDVNGKPRCYFQTRLKDPVGDDKYMLPSGKWLEKEGKNRTWPWIPPMVVETYEKGEEIETLFLTEGAFKASLAARYGMQIIGLTSITHYKGLDGELYQDLQRIIIKCKVKNVVILWDGDCLNISEKALARRVDLTTRPAGFYMSAKRIRKLIRDIEFPEGQELPAVYYYHVVPQIYPNEKPKGLDDLLIVAKKKGDIDAVVKQALQPQGVQTYFKKFDITDTTITLREYFALHDRNAFYKRHREVIKANEFKFFGDLLHWNEDEDEVKMISPKWASELFWVGDEYFMEVDLPGVGNVTRKELVSRTATTLTKRFGSNFWRHLDPFDGFCNLPEHLNYQKIIEANGRTFYNQYFPVKHPVQEGDWSHIKGFIQHIFGTEKVTHSITGEEIPRWELGLDYVQKLYLQPVSQLPVLILFSPENKTGKSTFGLLMAKIFGDNVVPIGNSDLQSDFNSTYSSKLLAVCEETLLERKREAEKIKAISTSPRILVNPKGQKQYMIDFFCKFIFTSNNPRMIYVNRHDTRFWIIKVPQFQKEIPNMLKIMEAEIPAFLHHLQNRSFASEAEGRMHFHDSLLRTDALEDTVRINEPGDATELRERIAELFIKDPAITRIEMPLASIREEFFGAATKTGWIRELLRDYLMVEQLLNKQGNAKVKRGTYPKFSKNGNGEICREEIAWIGRPYIFNRSQFVTEESPEDYKEMADEKRQAAVANGAVVSTPIGDPPPDDLPF